MIRTGGNSTAGNSATSRQTIEATFLGERHRWDDTIVGDCELISDERELAGQALTIKATSERADPLRPDMPYRFYGRMKDTKYGKQFQVSDWVQIRPTGREAIINYLYRQAEIGKKTAEIMFDIYGKDCLSKLRDNPDAVSAAVLEENKATRFTAERAGQAAEKLAGDEETESIAVELIELLAGRNFPKNLHRRIIGKLGVNAVAKVKRNPYLLYKFDGVGFKSADNLYLELGHPKNRLKRQAICLHYCLENDRDGHTWMSKTELQRLLLKFIDAKHVNLDRAIALAKRARMIDEYRACPACQGRGGVPVLAEDAETGELRNDKQACFRCQGSGGDRYYATLQRSINEQEIAKIVVRQNGEPAKWLEWIDESKLADLSDHQRVELLKALAAKVCAFGGIPGTGKTYTMARLVSAISGEVSEHDVAVVAPTGKAAVRMTENLADYGLGMRARTIHSLLGVVNVGGGMVWEHDEFNPFEQTVFIVDETSMVDTDLFAAFLRALPRDAHVLLIGDIYQLPPVGHGAPLRDLRAAGLPKGDLEEIKRQKEPGRIVEACDAIRRGRPFRVSPKVEIGTVENLGLIATESSAESVEKVVELLKQLKAQGLDPVWDCQVVVAVNEKGELCRKTINKRLQRELNPLGHGAAKTPFRAGDKVICLKNGFVPDANGGDDEFVANGELGRVDLAETGYTAVTMGSPRREVKIPRGQTGEEGDSGCSFDLAYGVTCHKLQGSQAKVVIVVLDENAKGLCSREWLYTAISRAESACWLVGSMATANAMIRRVSLTKRRTFLAERLRAVSQRVARHGINWEDI